MPVVHTIAIALHALSALGAFFVGIALLAQRTTLRQAQLARILVALLVSMAVFLFVAILSHWSRLPTIEQRIFGGLFVLLIYMVWRSVQAAAVLSQPRHADQRTILNHVGFVLIALFDGFVTVGALDLRAPG